MLQDRAVVTLAQHYKTACSRRDILFICDMEERRWRREQMRKMNDFNVDHQSGFDVHNIRWLFENRMGQVHPEADWYHPAWNAPQGILAAYDAD